MTVMSRSCLFVLVAVVAVVLQGCGDGGAREPEMVEGIKDKKKFAKAEVSRLPSFEALVEKWATPAAGVARKKDVSDFSKAFKALPQDDRLVALARAVQRIPEANTRLLTGILMDGGIDAESVRMVYVEILNRDDEIKMPILQAIARDKNHPCQEEASFVLGMNGSGVDEE